MYPDDVVSAHHFDGLAQELASHGWEVEALPCNRGCRDETLTYSPSADHCGVRYSRVWRPRFRQSSFLGRLANSAWMLASWARLALRPASRRPDAVVIGTDPMFAVLAAIPLRLLAPRIRIAHWCFDMHPEAAISAGMVGERGPAARLVKAAMRLAYRRCDVIADLGPCMRARLRCYRHGVRETELTPWALIEPAAPAAIDPTVRHELFGAARLGLLYSGNFGEAHDYAEFLDLARALADEPGVGFCFAVRGNRAAELRAAVERESAPVRFAGFAPLEEVEKRLGAADIHLASLNREFAGIAVPSKYFGSLAAGRPVVFAGPPDCAIAEWTRRYGTGWVLTPDTVGEVAADLRAVMNDPARLAALQEHCHHVYHQHFSRAAVGRRWDAELRGLLAADRPLRAAAATGSEGAARSGKSAHPA